MGAGAQCRTLWRRVLRVVASLASLTAVAAMALVLPGAAGATDSGRVGSFQPLGKFVVPGGGVAEITSATPDGKTLVYTDSDAGEVGFVDLSDPASPVLDGVVSVGGSPTSVDVSPDGSLALVTVQTSTLEEGEPPEISLGKLVAVDLARREVAGSVELGAGPDSVAVTEIGRELAATVAVENEPVVVDDSGNLTDEEEPGNPGDVSEPGFIQVVTVNRQNVAASRVTDVRLDLSGTDLVFPDDPQPEFVDVREGRAAVSLQENNGIAVLDLANAVAGEDPVESVFSLGVASDRPADLSADAEISFSETYPADVADEPEAGTRMPDGISWSDDGSVLYSADEGELDFTGGRGWSAWSPEGEQLFDSGDSLETSAVARGHYPEAESEDKGIEVENIETGIYGGTEFAFVTSEAASFAAVYRISDSAQPELVQILPTGIAPEGLLALPDRNLFVTADEDSGTISVFGGVQGGFDGVSEERPTLFSSGLDEPFSALSGFAASPQDPQSFYAVPDDALTSRIFNVEVQQSSARVREETAVTKDGEQASYDLEGIANNTSAEDGGYWLASEGNAEFGKPEYLPNLLVRVDQGGNVLKEIPLPQDVDSPEGGLVRSNGFEGVAVSDDGRYLLAPIQRGYEDDDAVGGVEHTRIARYDLEEKTWDFFLYPLDPYTQEPEDPEEPLVVGLSEIVNLPGDRYAVIERDDQVGGAAQIKRVYSFSLDGVAPSDGPLTPESDLAGKVIDKTLLVDVLDEFSPFEKVEGLALTSSGELWAGLDNDGGEVETLFVRLGSPHMLAATGGTPLAAAGAAASALLLAAGALLAIVAHTRRAKGGEESGL